MSWPLASFLLVALVLLAGWLAYERSRPSARMVAVVATLAALAALGRDAFVALPEVKPITAIALVVGYALGPLPGFTVGALGMFASNMVLGQGPYTPWQMAAWGLVGLAGAALGRLTRRRMSRLSLALACALTAFLAKQIMDIYTWTLGASHTPAAYLLVAGAALPFDLTDTAASFLFGLAFGPELARVLARVRARMDVRWAGAAGGVAGGTVVSVLLVLALAPAAAHAGATRGDAPAGVGGGHGGRGICFLGCHRARVRTYAREWAPKPTTPPRRAVDVYSAAAVTRSGPIARAAGASVSRELAYLASAQDATGGFGAAPGQASSELYTGWAAIGLAAGGRDPAGVRRDGHSVLDALRAQAGTLSGPGDLERTILALYASHQPVGAIDGHSLVGALLHYRRSDGSFSEQVNITAFAIFALRAAGISATGPTLGAAGRWLSRQQNADGGFSFASRGAASDVDDTAAALQALVDAGAGRGSSGVARAVSYILRAQNLDGGLPQQPGGESNAQSTAWAIQALDAAGRQIEAVRRDRSRSPLGYLQSLLAPNGSIRYSRTSAQAPVWVTAEALPALVGAPFPVGPAG
jgi:energy-coupling factor transport system substrate-specific component